MLSKYIKPVFIIFFCLFSLAATAQNILFINDGKGEAGDTIPVSVGINNDTAFVSFQCDMILPEGFSYIPGSITLSNRSADHVVNATNVEGNTLRILSYSLSNSRFLDDTGTVATLLVSTPHDAGTYYISLENGIIGNAESVNILDSLSGGTINLTPVGIINNKVNNRNRVSLFPNPFNKVLHLSLPEKGFSDVTIETYNSSGMLISTLNRKNNPDSFVNLTFTTDDLLGIKAAPGIYLVRLLFKTNNSSFEEIRKIYYKN